MFTEILYLGSCNRESNFNKDRVINFDYKRIVNITKN